MAPETRQANAAYASTLTGLDPVGVLQFLCGRGMLLALNG
jgi:hypothetical protein